MKLARHVLLVLVIVAFIIAGIVAAFYGVEDWRGARAWEECRLDLQARGEPLDVAAFIPPPVPDDRNLAMAPLFVRMYRYRVNPATKALTFPPGPDETPLRGEVAAMPRGKTLEETPAPNGTGDWASGHAVDLAAWQQYYRSRPDFPHAPEPGAAAEDVLTALTKFQPILDELAQAADARPQARFPVDWMQQPPWLIAMPHGSALQNLTLTLRMRAVAELALGRNGPAMRDIALMFRLRQAEAADPVFIALLVNQVQTASMLQPVWEGLASRRWSAAELAQLQGELQRIDFLAEDVRAIRCERLTFLAATADGLKAHGGAARMLNAVESFIATDKLTREQQFYGRLLDLIPGGWWDQNKAFGFRLIQEDEIDTVDVAGHHVRLAKSRAAHDAMMTIPLTPYSWLMRVMSLSIAESVTRRAIAGQAGVDQAVIACALERFYLERQAYPGQLGELTPAYLDHLPPDVIDGAPMRYRQTPQGRYLLYSVGWNGRDDGGQTVFRKNSTRVDIEQGDLVWWYPAPQSPASIQRSK